MLQTIREHTQGWIAGAIISVIILSFSLWGVHSYFEGNPRNNIIAEVNGIDITKQQLSTAFERMRRQIEVQFGNKSSFYKNPAALKERALQGLIELEVLKQGATAQGFQVFNSQVDSYLQSMPEFQINGQFSSERFHQLLSGAMLSIDEFFNLLQTNMLIEQPKLGIIFSTFAFPDETNAAISLINQERDISYINLPFTYFENKVKSASLLQLQDYYKKHQSAFMKPEQVTVEYVQLNLADIAKQINATSEQLQKFYDENASAFIEPKRWKLNAIKIPLPTETTHEAQSKINDQAQQIATKLKSAANLNDLTKLYPADLGSDYLSAEQLPPEFKTQLMTLKLNQISPAIKTKQGIYFIQPIDIKNAGSIPFDLAIDKVKKLYIRQKAEEVFADKREQLASLSYEHPDTLQDVSRELNLNLQTSEAFSKDKPGQAIAQYKRIRDMAFSNDVLNLRNNSDVLQINPETLIVLRIKSHSPAAVLAFKDVELQISKQLQMQEMTRLAENLSKEIQKQLTQGKSAETIATENQLSWNQVGFVSRYHPKVDSAVLDLAFRLAKPSPAKPNSYGFIRTTDGYAIVALKGVRDGQVDQKQKEIFSEQIQSSDGLLEYELYKQSLIQNAKIKANT